MRPASSVPFIPLMTTNVHECSALVEGQRPCCYDYVLLMEAGSGLTAVTLSLKRYESDYASIFRARNIPLPMYYNRSD